MSAANYLLTEEQLLCCICLDVFTDPVTLPCGHNFCKNCITQHLNFNSQRQCPMCKERVDRKYKLGINTFISEMAVKFRQSAGKKARDQQSAKPGEVPCDVLTGTKQTVSKSYLLLALGLACLTIHFATNMKLHQTVSSLKTDQHIDTVENVAGSVCAKHGKPLELYCKNEQMPICRSCADSSHRFHHVVPLKEEYKVKKMELRKTEAKIQQKILERQLKNDEIKHSVKLSKDAADREITDGVKVFATLIQSLERAKAELIWMTEEKQKTTEKQAKGFIQELEQETSELVETQAEAEQLSNSKDHLHFLQSFASLNTSALTKDWTDVSICPPRYEGILRTAMVRAVDQLTEAVRNEMKRLHDAELKTIQQSAVEVTLDPDTAHTALFLSDDGKQVHYGDVRQKLLDNSKRFERGIFVLGKQSFSCGRFHYERFLSWVCKLTK